MSTDKFHKIDDQELLAELTSRVAHHGKKRTEAKSLVAAYHRRWAAAEAEAGRLRSILYTPLDLNNVDVMLIDHGGGDTLRVLSVRYGLDNKVHIMVERK
jgi:hypothetical protein